MMNFNMIEFPKCLGCNEPMLDGRHNRKYCSTKCKGVFRRTLPSTSGPIEHACRVCETRFVIGPGQGNKWLCSPECMKASLARSVRNFHERRPKMEAIYRQRTREKIGADSQNKRFYRLNPNAPRACESCGEDRVLEVAHKPGHERFGARRGTKNMNWPEQVWVLCPTCHRLHDRMGYSPEELGLHQ